jgi:hypothetical protein
MDKHSNNEILKEMKDSSDLAKKVQKFGDDALDSIHKIFKKQFGTDVPSASSALVLVEDTTVQFADSSVISDYTEGLENITKSALEKNYPAVATATVQFVGSVLNNIIGSSTIGSTNNFESEQSGDTTIAVIVQSSLISKKNFKIKQDFFVSAYMLIVFPKQ